MSISTKHDQKTNCASKEKQVLHILANLSVDAWMAANMRLKKPFSAGALIISK